MKSIEELIFDYNTNCRPLKFIKEETGGGDRRFNVVTDSIAPHSLLGGVATALILATLVCCKFNWRLRIITRTTECNPLDYKNFISFQGFAEPAKGVEYISDYVINKQKISRISITDNDIFMATSWWSAKALLNSDYIKRIFYIIQEEETFFYPYGDMHLWCKEIMNDERIDFIVNSSLLFDFFKNTNYKLIIENGRCFEPAFPKTIYNIDKKIFSDKRKYKMFFYGRPNNPRNLFYHGLEILDVAIEQNIIDTDVWDIYMAGGECSLFHFSNGYCPILNGRMSWKEYAEFTKTIDLAFCLMYTPHPSYPPLDMLSSGAVVLTNNFANKRNLQYSKNMIMEELDKEQMLLGMSKAIKLAKDMKVREENYNKTHIEVSWETTFIPIINYIKENTEEKQYV